MSTKEIAGKVQKLRKLQAQADGIKEQIEALEAEIKAEMAERGTDELKAGVFTVCWKAVTSKRFDTASFKKDQPLLYELYRKASTTRRFTVA